VNDAREALVRVGAHRHHVPSFAFGDVAILEDALVFRHEVIEPREHARARGLVLAAQLLQARAGAIGEQTVGIEREAELVGEVVERRIGRARFEERRRARASDREEPAEEPRGAQRLADLADLDGREHARRSHATQRVRDVRELHHGKRLGSLEELRGLTSLVEQSPRSGARRREGQPERERTPHVRDATRRERREQTIPLEVVPRLVGAGVAELIGHGWESPT
jgi:hypothetical protein